MIIKTRQHNLCPHVLLQTVVWLFYAGFGAVASSLLSGLSGYVNIGLVLLCKWHFCTRFLQHFHKVFCSYSGIDLTYQSMFISRRQRVSFLSGMTAARSHDVYTCVLLFVQMNVAPSGIWKLLPRMNQTCGGLQLVFWGLGLFILIFPWFQAKRHWVWR